MKNPVDSEKLMFHKSFIVKTTFENISSYQLTVEIFSVSDAKIQGIGLVIIDACSDLNK